MTPFDDDDESTTADRRPVSERVVTAVGRARDAAPTELDPLYDAIDPEAVDALFPDRGVPSGDSVREFAFTYEGFVVRVSADGTVDLIPEAADSSREDVGTPAASVVLSGSEAPD